jgi:hypothetical protein
MKRQILSFTLSTLVGVGVMLAAPVSGQSPDGSQPQAQAEQGQRHQPDPARQARMLTKRLNLNADQQSQVLAALNDRAQQIKAIRADNSLSEQDRRAKIRTLRQDTDAKITAVLTADQKQAYEQMQQQAHERARQHREGSSTN